MSDFLSYLDDRREVLAKTEKRLCSLQSKYESYFAEVTKVRETEIGQLVELTLSDRSALPDWFNRELDAMQREVEAELDGLMANLRGEATEAAARAEKERQASMNAGGG